MYFETFLKVKGGSMENVHFFGPSLSFQTFPEIVAFLPFSPGGDLRDTERFPYKVSSY